MSEKDINRWHADLRRNGKPEPLPNGLVDFNRWEPAPITDEMLSELTQRFHYAGAPWNCRSMPLSPSDREYMFLLSCSMQGLVSRMRRSDERAAELLEALKRCRFDSLNMSLADLELCRVAIYKATE